MIGHRPNRTSHEGAPDGASAGESGTFSSAAASESETASSRATVSPLSGSTGRRAGTTRAGRQPPSLRARALAYLSRREHSRQELRAKLLTPPRNRRSAACAVTAADTDADADADVDSPPGPPSEAEVDAALDWLQAHGYLSDERFVESRLHARTARHGSLRIRQELARHGVEMSAEQAAQLRDTELARAREIWRRRFGTVATDPRERARQARFLASRGFPSDIVRRVIGGDDEA